MFCRALQGHIKDLSYVCHVLITLYFSKQCRVCMYNCAHSQVGKCHVPKWLGITYPCKSNFAFFYFVSVWKKWDFHDSVKLIDFVDFFDNQRNRHFLVLNDLARNVSLGRFYSKKETQGT